MGTHEQSFEDSIFSLPSIGMENMSTGIGCQYNADQSLLMGLQCCIPAQVVKYNREQHMVLVQPLVPICGSEDEDLVRGRFWVTLMRHHCGNYLIDAPLKESELDSPGEGEEAYMAKIKVGGDTGWVIASDRNTWNAKAGNPSAPGIGYEHMDGPQPTTANNMHSHADGFFIPDRWNYFPLEQDDLDNDRLVIQSADGTQRISIGQCDIKIFSSNTTINTTSDCTINAGAGVNVNASSDINVKTDSGIVNVEAGTVTVKADAVSVDADVMSVTGGGGFKGAASGTLSAGTIAQVKDGIIVSLGQDYTPPDDEDDE